MVKYTGALTVAPGFKFRNMLKKIRGIDAAYTSDIKEILLEKNISNQEKLDMH
jgi:hypothetical protein